MGFLRNRTIKAVTKRTVRYLMNILAPYFFAENGADVLEIKLKKALKEIHQNSKLAALPIDKNNESAWDEVLVEITMHSVRQELSYDHTVYDLECTELMINTAFSELRRCLTG